jgi:putative peptidoglycan lipid II flippase
MRNAVVYTVLTALGFAANLVYLLLLGSIFGAGRELDALFASATVPQFLEILILGSLGFALVPVLVRARESGPDEMWRTAGQVTVLSMALFAALGAVGSLFASPIVRLTNPGFDAAQIRLGAGLSRLHWLTEILMAVRVCLTSVQLARGRFVLAGLSPLIGASAALACLWLLVEPVGVAAGAAGLVVSTLVQCAVLWPYGVSSWRPHLHGWTRLRPLWRQMAPLVGGAAYSRTDIAVDRLLLSFLPAGAITFLTMGNRLVVSLAALTVSGVSAVWLPEMARHSARAESERLRSLFLRGIEALILAGVFVCVLMPAFARDVLDLVFRHGQFSADDVRQLSVVTLALIGLYMGGSLGQLTANAFYAQGDTRTPALLGALAYTLSLALRLIGVHFFGLLGIAAAASIGSLAGVTAQIIVLRRRWDLLPWRFLVRTTVVYGVAALASVTAAAAVLHGASSAARATVGLLVAAFLYLVIVSMIGGDAPRTARVRALSWLRGRGSGPRGPGASS